MILRADYPHNHVSIAVRRGDKWRAATATGTGHIPTVGGVDGRRTGGSNAESREDGVAVVVGAERDIGTLFGPISDGCLKNSAAGNMRS
jgi:hypothetical protein